MRINTNKIQMELDRLGWPVQKLADRMRCTRQWVYHIMGNPDDHSFKTVEKLADALGVEEKDLIK